MSTRTGAGGRVAAVAMLLAGAARPALAHEGRPLAPHDLPWAWELEPVVVVSLALAAWLYAHGLRALRRAAARPAGPARLRGASRGHATAFAAGWTVLALALVSPLHPLGGVLFSAHMAQHELLVAVAAPLLVYARPLVPMLWALPPAWRRRLGRFARRRAVRAPWRAVTRPLDAFLLHALALWLWHLPAAYQASLRSETAHAAQHASFLLTALLFWWSLLHVAARRRRGLAVLSLFLTSLHTGLLGALLTFSDGLWYPAYGATTAAWGLAPLEDQQLAGLVMWMPGGIAYLLAALALLATWLRDAERRAPERVAAALPVAGRGGAP